MEKVPRHPERPPAIIRDRYWVWFCLSILLLKLFLLILDPNPKLFLGDSGSYIWTALTGWIPDDRSFFIGYVIRWLGVWTESLTPLLIVQCLLSGGTALMAALICDAIIEGRRWLCYSVGVVCALDPLEVVWERYVMAEAVSLFLYALMVYFCVAYLRRRRIPQLCAVHVAGVLAIGFRMSYLLTTQLTAPLLPLLAFLPDIARALHRGAASALRKRVATTVAIHLAVSCLTMWVLHNGYKRLNGKLSEREPDYMYATGFHLLAFWAPALDPSDAPDERLAAIIARGDEFGIKEMFGRNAQRFARGHLVDLWQKAEPDPRLANDIAKKTAIHLLTHHPLRVAQLTFRTFAQYFNFETMRENSRLDLGHNDISPEQMTMLAERFRSAPDPQIAGGKLTLLQEYFRAAWPYYYVVLLSPALGIAIFFLSRRKAAVGLILLHSGPTLALSIAVAGGPTVRYLQPISFLTILLVAIGVDGVLNRSDHDRAAGEDVEKIRQAPPAPVASRFSAQP